MPGPLAAGAAAAAGPAAGSKGGGAATLQNAAARRGRGINGRRDPVGSRRDSVGSPVAPAALLLRPSLSKLLGQPKVLDFELLYNLA